MERDERDEREVALSANVAAYTAIDSREYVNGAPHLKHRSVSRIYTRLVETALSDIGKPPEQIHVLDLGAGDGLASLAWFEHGVRLTAVDSSPTMLAALTRRASVYGRAPRTVVADALDFVSTITERFDVVTHVSMLHHVPDYLDLVARSAARVAPGGALLTFQDPLRYDTMSASHHRLELASYFIWRAGQGNLRRGLRTRWRRLRGVFSEKEVVDFEDYHLVRNGVDSDAIADLLRSRFSRVEVVPYWSTYARILQRAGERLRLRSTFGVLATGRSAD